MKSATYIKTMFFLGLAGLLFSGYMSAIKLFTATCAFNSPCPYFLGYPACFYGFGMFLVIFVSAILGYFKKIYKKTNTWIILIVSGLGIIFSGYFTIPEIKKLLIHLNTGAPFNLPTCAFGLIFYILIFILSFWHLTAKQNLGE